MAVNLELAFYLVELKYASIGLQNLATALDSNKLQFTFNKSKGETVDKLAELVVKYNEFGASLSQLVKDVKKSTDMTSEGVKKADQHLAKCWESI